MTTTKSNKAVDPQLEDATQPTKPEETTAEPKAEEPKPEEAEDSKTIYNKLG